MELEVLVLKKKLIDALARHDGAATRVLRRIRCYLLHRWLDEPWHYAYWCPRCLAHRCYYGPEGGR